MTQAGKFAANRSVNGHAHPEFAEAVAISRFWRNIDIRTDEECWIWTGDTTAGYGAFYFRGRMWGAHELALSFTSGEKRIESLDTCHSCDNPPCCNPSHLRFASRKSNVADMYQRGREPRQGRLTDEEIIEIRERRAAGARQKDLADQYGVSDGQISMIVRGLRWPSIGGPIEKKQSQYRKAV